MGVEGNASTCRTSRCIAALFFPRIRIYEGRTSGPTLKSRTTRASCSSRPPVLLGVLSPIDLSSYRCTARGLPFYKGKKKWERKNLAASLTRATWLVARFLLFATRAPLYIVPSPFFRQFLKSWIRTPCPRSDPASNVRQDRGLRSGANEFSFFFYMYARSPFFYALLHFLFLSLRASVDGRPAQYDGKKFH